MIYYDQLLELTEFQWNYLQSRLEVKMTVLNLVELIKQRDRLIEYLRLKVDMNDWHGVADAAMDLREVEAQMSLHRQLVPVERRNESDY